MIGLEERTLGHYELQQIIGKGGMADVYMGYDTHFERSVAVKVFNHDKDEMLRRFIREARIMGSLHHNHLIPIYSAGYGVIDHIIQYYIVLPLMSGGTLHSRIERSPLALDEACHYLCDIASALDYIHAQGIIHRDIKASNVLLDEDGNCYLSDFGIARILTRGVTRLTLTGGLLGTADYIAPELFEEKHKADERSDLYSLGILLYEMVTGKLPFSGESQLAVATMHMNKRPPLPHTLNHAISQLTERVMLRVLEKRPELRYGSATEFADAFCSSLKVSVHSRLWNAKLAKAEVSAVYRNICKKIGVIRKLLEREKPHFSWSTACFVATIIARNCSQAPQALGKVWWNASTLLEEVKGAFQTLSFQTLSSPTATPVSTTTYNSITSDTFDRLPSARRYSSTASVWERIMVVMILAMLLAVLGAICHL